MCVSFLRQETAGVQTWKKPPFLSSVVVVCVLFFYFYHLVLLFAVHRALFLLLLSFCSAGSFSASWHATLYFVLWQFLIEFKITGEPRVIRRGVTVLNLA